MKKFLKKSGTYNRKKKKKKKKKKKTTHTQQNDIPTKILK